MFGIFIRRDAFRSGSIKELWVPPMFFVSVASKGFKYPRKSFVCNTYAMACKCCI
jgi:hypothetical protein